MRFAESFEGPWRIYAGALESPLGDGYTAGVAVTHAERHDAGWREDQLSCGHRWATADEALRFALAKGREFTRSAAPLTTRRLAA